MNLLLPRQRSGFLLIELVIALGILTFAVLAIYGLLPIGLQVSKQSRGDLRTAEILAMVAEDFRTWQKMTVASGSETPFYRLATGFDPMTGRFSAASGQVVIFQDGSTDRADGERFAVAAACEPIAGNHASRVQLCVARGQVAEVSVSVDSIHYSKEDGVSFTTLILNSPTQ